MKNEKNKTPSPPPDVGAPPAFIEMNSIYEVFFSLI